MDDKLNHQCQSIQRAAMESEPEREMKHVILAEQVQIKGLNTHQMNALRLNVKGFHPQKFKGDRGSNLGRVTHIQSRFKARGKQS
eukprot:4671473-Amphidinium_carterae.1